MLHRGSCVPEQIGNRFEAVGTLIADDTISRQVVDEAVDPIQQLSVQPVLVLAIQG